MDNTVESLRMLNDILAAGGYKPRPVDDSQAARGAALAQPPSLILLDARMPGKSGFDVCRRLKEDDRTRDVTRHF